MAWRKQQRQDASNCGGKTAATTRLQSKLGLGEATAEAKTWLGLVAEASHQGGIGKTAATVTSVIQTWLDGSGSGDMAGAAAEQTP